MTTAAVLSEGAWLSREEAAAYISRRVGVTVTATVLANRASQGNGPPYRIWGRRSVGKGGRGRYAVYKTSDLDVWIEAQFHDPDTKSSAV